MNTQIMLDIAKAAIEKQSQKPSIRTLVPNLAEHIKNIVRVLESIGYKDLEPARILDGLSDNDPYNKMLSNLMGHVVYDSPTGWSVSLYSLEFEYQLTQSKLFESGLIGKNGSDEIVVLISDTLASLFMQAIHRAYPYITELDSNGILRIQSM